MNQSVYLVDYFINNFPIEQIRSPMYKENDIYYEIPTLMFRFSKELDESIYMDLRKCIESYVGNLEWTEFKAFRGKKVWNHSICPKRYYEKLKYAHDNNILISNSEYFSEKEYKELCEKAVADIPKLFDHIKKNFNPNLEDY